MSQLNFDLNVASAVKSNREKELESLSTQLSEIESLIIGESDLTALKDLEL